MISDNESIKCYTKGREHMEREYLHELEQFTSLKQIKDFITRKTNKYKRKEMKL